MQKKCNNLHPHIVIVISPWVSHPRQHPLTSSQWAAPSALRRPPPYGRADGVAECSETNVSVERRERTTAIPSRLARRAIAKSNACAPCLGPVPQAVYGAPYISRFVAGCFPRSRLRRALGPSCPFECERYARKGRIAKAQYRRALPSLFPSIKDCADTALFKNRRRAYS